VSLLTDLARLPRAAVETTNLVLTTGDARIGVTPKDPVWTHRGITLWRYRSNQRRHPVPVLLVFALINRPDVFDLRPGNSFVEFLLDEGHDVFLLDWGMPGDGDHDLGLDNYVCDELPWGIREVLRASGARELTVVGWCIGAALTAMYLALHPDGPVRNAVLLTMPVDTGAGTYTTWVNAAAYDVDALADDLPGGIPGPGIDWANKMMKPVTNFWTTYRKLFETVLEGRPDRAGYQSMAKWVADNPPFPATAFRQWITWFYRENRLVRGRLRLRGRRVDLGRIRAACLVVTADADHIAPRSGTLPFLDLVGSDDVTHLDGRGGHIGLMAGSKARREIWPQIGQWLAPRSGPTPRPTERTGSSR
jgi:polyhydroxyalkanoate synthase